jgi:hypothetical protein
MQIFAQYGETTISLDVEPSDTIAGVKAKIEVQEGILSSLQQLTFNGTVLQDGSVLSEYNIQKNAVLILTVSLSKQARQIAKLELAQTKRRAGGDTTKPYYRARNTYDLTRLPDTYNVNVPGADDNPNTGGLVVGRPWYSPFTTYEEVVSPGATISTTQTGPFKIAVRSTSYDTEPFVNAEISINDVLVVDMNGRGHTVLALTSTGTEISQTRFDTWDGPGIDNMNTALLGFSSGTVIAICTYDAGRIDSTLRATLNTYYGGTLTNTWGNDFPRTSHIFIGVKI